MRSSHLDREMRFVFRKTMIRCGLFSVAASILIASASWGFEQAEKKSADEGLRGIIAAEVPDDLVEEEFEALDGNWAQWSSDVATTVVKLYEGEDLNAAGQRDVLSTLQGKIAVMDRALADDRYASLFDPLLSLRGRLSRRVDLAEAALDTLELKPADVKAAWLKRAGKDVVTAVNSLEEDLNTIPNGTAWMPYVKAEELRKAAEAGTPDNAVLGVVKSRLAITDKFNEEQREFLGRPAFRTLAASIDSLLKTAKLELRPTDTETLRKQLATLFETVEQYESDSLSADAKGIQTLLASIGKLVPDGGERLEGVIRSRYLNSNLQIQASEKFLSRVFHEKRTEKGEVKDYLLGANVYGNQTTTTEVGIDVKPSENGGAFDVALTGVVQSNTAGATSQATVYTSGYHRFWAKKEVNFDGYLFSTKPANIVVYANNNTYGASTGFDGWPLFGAIGRSMAKREANRRRGQSEAIAEDRVRERVLPEMDKEIDKSFKDLNDRIKNNLNKRLKEAGIYPKLTTSSSSDTHLQINSQVLVDGELAGDVPNATQSSADALVVHVHESLLNNVANRMNFAGRTMTDKDIKTEIEKFLSTVTGSEVTLSDNKEKSDTGSSSKLIFAQVDPVRVQIEDGELNLVIRAGIKQEGKDDIPTQIVTIPLSYSVEGDEINIHRGAVKVAPLKSPESRTRQIARAGIMRKKVQSSMPDRTRERKVVLEREGKGDVEILITRIRALNGWLTVWAK